MEGLGDGRGAVSSPELEARVIKKSKLGPRRVREPPPAPAQQPAIDVDADPDPADQRIIEIRSDSDEPAAQPEPQTEQHRARLDLDKYKYGSAAVSKGATSRAGVAARNRRGAGAGAGGAAMQTGAIAPYVIKAGPSKKAAAGAADLPGTIPKDLFKELTSCVVCGEEWPARKMAKTKWVRVGGVACPAACTS